MTDINEAKKPIVLIICDFYFPGYKAGGGLRTLVHMVERFDQKFDFRIIARDNDGDGIPFDSVKINEWNDTKVGKAFYLSKNNIRLSKLRELISSVNPDIIYINSVFASLSILLLVLRKLKLINNIPIIVAPEGEISDGALQLKAKKKKIFTQFAKRANLYKDLIWKVAAEPEKFETERFKGTGGEIFIAPNMPSKAIYEQYDQSKKPFKEVGEAKMVFLSRYMRKKNFMWLMDVIDKVKGNLTIDIYGPIEDEEYWLETQEKIRVLPPNVKVNYKGVVPYESVLEKMFDYHFFILPTIGENFGHVFIEAMAVGCPLVISDRTPWIDLEKQGIGWDLSLEKPEQWIDILNHCIDLNNESYTELSSAARKFSSDWLTNPAIEEQTLTVLEKGLEKGLANAN